MLTKNRPAIALAIAAPLLVAGLAGCSGSGSADDQPNTKKAETTAFDWDVAFAKCMRDKGIDYPDPKPGDSGPVQTKVDDPAAYEQANDNCEAQIESDRGKRPVSEESRRKRDKANDEYADVVDCLRKKGNDVEVFDGGYRPKAGTQISDADVQACGQDTTDQKVIEEPK